ncbi:hypothetical protein AVEN_63441-1 [Araneus ventricosus]|uniref:Uncharacterized protein n=1 Tax=Araneus ventricosus TaxID=182803 RepID=A0A4Y2JVR3_ARAVE|nr:hypothetical protein AVEN_63441-1 [Araneus ventricosus]
MPDPPDYRIRFSGLQSLITASLIKYKVNEKLLPTGVPVFHVLNHTTKLHQLVGPKSWLIFHLLNQDGALLKNNPQAWEEHYKLKEIETFIKNLKVVNDTTELRVKRGEDFN